ENARRGRWRGGCGGRRRGRRAGRLELRLEILDRALLIVLRLLERLHARGVLLQEVLDRFHLRLGGLGLAVRGRERVFGLQAFGRGAVERAHRARQLRAQRVDGAARAAQLRFRRGARGGLLVAGRRQRRPLLVRRSQLPLKFLDAPLRVLQFTVQ